MDHGQPRIFPSSLAVDAVLYCGVLDPTTSMLPADAATPHYPRQIFALLGGNDAAR